LLFKAAGKALMQCAINPDFLGAQAGAVAMLHTWGQTLTYHPHIHMIVPGGGLSEDGLQWVPAKKRFFIPVKALSKVFRGILCRLLEENIANGNIRLPVANTDFKSLKTQCYSRNWVVYCKKPFSGSDSLIQYLGNYTHRVAISNHRLLRCENQKVSFQYKDYKAAGIRKTISLDAIEFIRRFMQQVLPGGFYKIWYFGFMAICNMKDKLATCFDLIQKPSFLPVLEGLSALEVWRTITVTDPLFCPICKTGVLKPSPIVITGSMKPG
jgi:hypothetical protein